MNDSRPIDDLLQRFSAAAFEDVLREAFQRGLAAGIQKEAERVRTGMLSLLKAPAEPTLLGDQQGWAARHFEPPPTTALHVSTEPRDTVTRAPRGLTREIIALILDDEPGIDTARLQKKAVDLDSRVSEKTVYNELNREAGRLYRSERGGWYPIHAAQPASQLSELAQSRPQLSELGPPRSQLSELVPTRSQLGEYAISA